MIAQSIFHGQMAGFFNATLVALVWVSLAFAALLVIAAARLRNQTRRWQSPGSGFVLEEAPRSGHLGNLDNVVPIRREVAGPGDSADRTPGQDQASGARKR